jgi:predicted nucleic acid-binding protein
MVVADSGPLIALGLAERLDLLRDLLGRLVVPGAVFHEVAAIALAWDVRPNGIVLLDDRRARRLATSLAVPLIGTIGILARAKGAGLIPAVGPEVQRMRARGLYVRDDWLRTVLRAVGE